MASTTETHFWMTSFPFTEAALFFSGHHPGAVAMVKVFDRDGALCNEVTVSNSDAGPAFIELDSLLERCKIESGMRHAHLLVQHDAGFRPVCRIHNRAGATLVAPLTTIVPDRAAFSPVTITPNRSCVLVLVNQSNNEAVARIRMTVGSKTPDLTVNLAPFATSLVALDQEFRAAILENAGEGARESGTFPELRTYVRVSARNENPIGMQVLEFVDRAEQGVMLSGVSS